MVIPLPIILLLSLGAPLMKTSGNESEPGVQAFSCKVNHANTQQSNLYEPNQFISDLPFRRLVTQSAIYFSAYCGSTLLTGGVGDA